MIILDYGGRLQIYERDSHLTINSLPGRAEGATTVEGWVFGLYLLGYNVIYWRP